MDNMSDIEKFANLGSNIDFITSLSQVAYENGFVKPEITTNYDLKISNGKHPIIMKNTNDFISNNLELTSKKFIHIIT
ncbi:MAG: hypothetical protein LBU14_03660 [Candidatus Peribacteria bacterium]|jgi:DNA mismatch repair protein MutS|nr:hypothetical protein [Candidatus Peribacteria bacterium]